VDSASPTLNFTSMLNMVACRILSSNDTLSPADRVGARRNSAGKGGSPSFGPGQKDPPNSREKNSGAARSRLLFYSGSIPVTKKYQLGRSCL